MPIRETSFRIGCGRYRQAPGILATLGEEVRRLGNAPLVVGGKTALDITRATIEESLSASCEKYEIVLHPGTCNEPRARELAAEAAEKGLDVIVGVGGGVLMDFAKLIADLADLPIINVPTSSATCAAYTPLSVCYTPDGETVGTKHFPREVNAVLVDTAIVANQPSRLFLAGVFDALAKFLEIKQRFNEAEDYPLGLDWAYVLSKRSFEDLSKKTALALQDIRDGKITQTVEQVIFCTIAATGVISGIARGSNQCALAHKFYEGTRAMFLKESRPYLHGEIVGVGLLLQNHFNGETENNDFLLSLMKQYKMPCSISNIGLQPTEAIKQLYYERLMGGSAIDETNPEELEKLQAGLDYLWTLN